MELKTNRHFLLIIGLLIAFITVKGQHTALKQTFSLTQSDTAKTLEVKTGNTITLTLPDHVDGGYRFDTIQYDHHILLLKSYNATPPGANSPAGAPGLGTWRFTAINKGITPIKLTASRPWKGGGTVAIFENKIDVK